MSLDTLLEAAKYLDKIEANRDVTNANANHASGIQINKQILASTGNGSTEAIQVAGGHLRLDPNLPISFHFHTYSSQAPSRSSYACGPNGVTLPVNSTNRRNSLSLSGFTEVPANSMMVISGVSSNPVSNRSGYAGHSKGRGSRSSGGSGGEGGSDKDSTVSNRHRELHKTLEKNRRAHLRSCFEQLKQELPKSEYSDKKTSHINIIHCAIKYIQCLKRAEIEFEHEKERLARTKMRYQNQITQLKEELVSDHGNVDVDGILRQAAEHALEVDCTVLMDGIRMVYDTDEHSDGDVIVDLEAGQEYDDETTTTASECADDVREGLNSSASFSGVTNASFLSQCHA